MLLLSSAANIQPQLDACDSLECVSVANTVITIALVADTSQGRTDAVGPPAKGQSHGKTMHSAIAGVLSSAPGGTGTSADVDGEFT